MLWSFFSPLIHHILWQVSEATSKKKQHIYLTNIFNFSSNLKYPICDSYVTSCKMMAHEKRSDQYSCTMESQNGGHLKVTMWIFKEVTFYTTCDSGVCDHL